LITLDLDLPDLYGQVVLRQLRRDPATAEVPVLVITAHPELLQSEDYRAATAILCKPFNLDTLTDILRSATEAL